MKKTISRKKLMIVGVMCLLIVVAIIAPVTLIYVMDGNQDTMVSFTKEVTVKDKKAEPQGSTMELSVLREGTYTFHVEWQMQERWPSFVSGCVVKDEQGRSVFAVTGDCVIADSVEMKLEPQTYTVEIHYMANKQDYLRFVEDYLTEKEGVKIADFDEESVQDGTWRMNYVIEAQPKKNILAGIVIIVTLVGIICAFVLIAATKTDESVKCRFDERQELVKGRGFKYGFFTLLISNIITGFIELAEFPTYAAQPGVAVIINCLFGIGVYVAYCVWNEGYFALNENKGMLMIIFAFLGIFNFILGAVNCIHGEMLQDGKLTYKSLNPFCGLLSVVLFVTMLLKKIFKDGKDEQI